MQRAKGCSDRRRLERLLLRAALAPLALPFVDVRDCLPQMQTEKQVSIRETLMQTASVRREAGRPLAE
ncbi:MAG: hypothetical protein GY822_19260 [Deltaproteobacteria bacterium]|nr:hypothetical protein [Deltaproteobacteria bacterium]